MELHLLLVWLISALWAGQAAAVAATDEYQDADPAQSGYLSNHNLHPTVVGSALFGELWRIPFSNKEKFYAKPLVYTPKAPGSRQLVILASTQNKIYAIDAINGTLIRTRQLPRPFLVSDISCADLPDTVGIVGTPIIDPLTDIMYFYSKTYRGAANGRENGIYQFYAINVVNFVDVAGYPILIDGSRAENDPGQYFAGGTHLQRPSLALINDVVYAGFGAHCDLFNYTGWIFGINIKSNRVVNIFSAATAPFTKPQSEGGGGGSAIWHSGMGFSTDSNTRMFFVTGNGEGHQNRDTPASGKTPLATLDETVVHMRIDPATGKLSLVDYFQPFDYISLDAADKDLGSSGFTLLDPSVFKGRNIARMGVTGGKNGKAYVLNLDDLGGFKLGPGGSDNCIQAINLDNPVFGGAGSFPLDGGFFYFTPTGSPMSAYKYGLDSSGKPVFTLAGKTAGNLGGRMGPVTVTSFKGQAGTGIVWVCDNNGGLRAFKAVPTSGGVVEEITIPPSGGCNKFSRPAFGDARVYVTTSSGILVALGSPVNLPLNCTDPVDFDRVTIGTSKTVTITCTANIATRINGVTLSDRSWNAQNSSLPTTQLQAGARFTFPVVWNPASPMTPGVKTGAITIHTTNGVARYSNAQPLNLRGTAVSSGSFLELNPGVVNFGGVVVGQEPASGVSMGFTIANSGSSDLTISKISFALTNQVDNTAITYVDVARNSDGTYQAGPAFKLTSLPIVNQRIAAGSTLSVTANFRAVDGVGNYASVLKIDSNGGSDRILLSGSAATSSKGRFEIQNTSGGWDKVWTLNFGNIVSGNSVVRTIRLCNDGGSPLVITKSKPPGGAELFATSMTDELYEGQNIAAGQCATATIRFQPVPMVPNTDPHAVSETWTLNVNDLTFGLHEVELRGTALARQLGPLRSDGTARYRYLGCYQDAVNGRLFSKNTNLGERATVGLCAETGLGNNFIFAGTQYHRECWQGDTPPPDIYYYPESASKCTWSCNGDVTQPCGGDGRFMNVFYDSTRYTPPGRGGSSSSTTRPLVSTSRTTTTSSRTTTRPPTTSTSRTTTTTSRTTSRAVSTRAVENPGSEYYTHIGCFKNPSTKCIYPSTKWASDEMTVFQCLDRCRQQGNRYAGLEYSRECYCGNTFVATEPADCSLLCAGNTTEICGGRSIQNVYEAVSLPSISSSSRTSSRASPSTIGTTSRATTTATTTTTRTTTTPMPPARTTSRSSTSPNGSIENPGVGRWSHLGCFADPGRGVKAVNPYRKYANDSMAVALCLDYCEGLEYKWAGLEYYRECFCGEAFAGVEESTCTAPCKGNTSEICGGSNRMNVYQFADLTT